MCCAKCDCMTSSRLQTAGHLNLCQRYQPCCVAAYVRSTSLIMYIDICAHYCRLCDQCWVFKETFLSPSVVGLAHTAKQTIPDPKDISIPLINLFYICQVCSTCTLSMVRAPHNQSLAFNGAEYCSRQKFPFLLTPNALSVFGLARTSLQTIRKDLLASIFSIA